MAPRATRRRSLAASFLFRRWLPGSAARRARQALGATAALDGRVHRPVVRPTRRDRRPPPIRDISRVVAAAGLRCAVSVALVARTTAPAPASSARLTAARAAAAAARILLDATAR